MPDKIEAEQAKVLGESKKLLLLGGRRRTASSARRRNYWRQVYRPHAAARQHFVRILHQPDAVVRVHNYIGRDYNPLIGVVGSGLLAIPKSRLRHDDVGVVGAVRIELKDLQPALVGKSPDLGERLVPVHIGIARPPINRMAPRECIEE